MQRRIKGIQVQEEIEQVKKLNGKIKTSEVINQDIIVSKHIEKYNILSDDEKQMNKIQQEHTITTQNHIPQLGVMLIGLGGNNGSTFVAGCIANKQQLEWISKNGKNKANFYGSFTQCATAHIGFQINQNLQTIQDVYKPIKDLLPMVSPVDFEISGWDINNANLYEACKRAHVLEPDLLEQIKQNLEDIIPLPAALNQSFIASNQSERVNNLVTGSNVEIINQLRADIRIMKQKVDKVIILWTANTEQILFPEIESSDQLYQMIQKNAQLPASVLYCVAAIEEQCLYLNGSPQNTFHPGIIQLAQEKGGFLAGSDFKSGQTRFKTIMSDYLIGSGIRLSSVVSYNHLGNNDGMNLSEDKCFQSKKISKSGVLDDAIKSNKILYPEENNLIDHEVVIKYIPFVGDSKRALDEYSSLIFMNGINTINSYNICEDSLLAVPIMYDIIILGELFTRMQIDGVRLGPILSYLSFFFKAPLTNHPEYVVNSFTRQRQILVNLLKAAAGYSVDDQTLISFKF